MHYPDTLSANSERRVKAGIILLMFIHWQVNACYRRDEICLEWCHMYWHMVLTAKLFDNPLSSINSKLWLFVVSSLLGLLELGRSWSCLPEFCFWTDSDISGCTHLYEGLLSLYGWKQYREGKRGAFTVSRNWTCFRCRNLFLAN